jgi:hypothetical protein
MFCDLYIQFNISRTSSSLVTDLKWRSQIQTSRGHHRFRSTCTTNKKQHFSSNIYYHTQKRKLEPYRKRRWPATILETGRWPPGSWCPYRSCRIKQWKVGYNRIQISVRRTWFIPVTPAPMQSITARPVIIRTSFCAPYTYMHACKHTHTLHTYIDTQPTPQTRVPSVGSFNLYVLISFSRCGAYTLNSVQNSWTDT